MGEARGPTVFLWDGFDEAGESCARASYKCYTNTKRLGGVDPSPTDQGRPHIKGVRTSGQTIFCGKAKYNIKEQGGQEAEGEMEEEGSGNESPRVGVLVGKEDGGSEVS